MTIGEKLKRERKKQGFDLDSVAKETKIAKMFLIAIEEDDLSSLPGGVYTRNFLRAYAKYLDLDEDIITSEYHEQYDVKPHFVIHQEQTKQDDLHFKRQRWHFLMTMFFLTLIIAAVAAVAYYFPFWKTEAANASPVPQVQTSLDGDRPSPSSNPPVQNEKPKSAITDNAPEASPKTAVKDDALPLDETTEDGDASALPQVPDEMTGETESGPSDSTLEMPSSANAGGVLPLETMSDIREYCADQNLEAIAIDQEGVRIEDVFAIEALENVDIEVYVDGNMATRRQLKPGQVRFYHYGNYNRVIIGDISKVNLQDGNQFFSGAALDQEYAFLPDFGPGGFLAQLHDILRNQEQPTP